VKDCNVFGRIDFSTKNKQQKWGVSIGVELGAVTGSHREGTLEYRRRIAKVRGNNERIIIEIATPRC